MKDAFDYNQYSVLVDDFHKVPVTLHNDLHYKSHQLSHTSIEYT